MTRAGSYFAIAQRDRPADRVCVLRPVVPGRAIVSFCDVQSISLGSLRFRHVLWESESDLTGRFNFSELALASSGFKRSALGCIFSVLIAGCVDLFLLGTIGP